MNTQDKRFGTIRARTLRNVVADALREAILMGKLAPGQRLVEANLAKEMGVSSIPVREALVQLEQQGLVTIVPNQGATVINPTRVESYQVLALRVYLEVLAARLAAVQHDRESLNRLQATVQRMAALRPSDGANGADLYYAAGAVDREFHEHLIEASGSPSLILIWQMVGAFMWATIDAPYNVQREGWHSDESLGERVRQEVERHQLLVDAIAAGSMDLAEEAVRNHHVRYLAGLDGRMLAALNWQVDRRKVGSSAEEQESRQPEVSETGRNPS